MSVPSQQYVALYQLQQLIIEDSLGTAAAGGIVTFYEDSNRTVTKNVFELAGNYSSGYTFNNIGPTVTLGAAGTFVDESGNDFVVYCYPYDANGNLQLYYVTVYGADGTLILTREAVPANVQYQTPSIMSSGALTENAISNPQFVEVNFSPTSSYTFSVSGTGTVSSLIPDWDIITTGSGSVTLTQTAAPTPTTAAPPYTNPPYVLGITSSGITALILRQRLFMSPTIFYGQVASLTFIGNSVSGTSYSGTIVYTPSSGTSYTVNYTIPASGGFAQLGDSFAITGTENTDDAPAGHVDIILNITPGANIQVSSFQLVTVSNIETVAAYIEEPATRQIDHLYHYAYPIVPIGSIIDFGGFVLPLHYLLCDGTAYSRFTYQQLFRAITNTETVTLTNTMSTFTVANGAIYYIGMAVEGVDIPASTTISGISTNTITISNAATGSISTPVTFFAWGDGDGSTTFNVPDLQDYVTAGANGSLFGSNLNSVGATGGSATYTLIANNLPPHTHTQNYGGTPAGVSVTGGGANPILTSGSVTGNGPGISAAFSIVQQTACVKKIIRWQ